MGDYGFPSDDLYCKANVVGGDGGHPFTECKADKGILVKKLGIWFDQYAFQGLQVTYADDTQSAIYGRSKDTYKEVGFIPGEPVTKSSTWGDGNGTRAGRVLFETKSGRFEEGKNVDGQTEWPTVTGSGVLAGICGRADAEIDAFALIFIRPVDSVEISEIAWLPSANGSGGPEKVEVARYTPSNSTPRDVAWTFANSIARTNTQQWSSTSTVTWGAKVSVAPKLTTLTGGWERAFGLEGSWNWAKAITDQTTTTNTTNVSYGISGTLKPGHALVCTAWATYGKGRIPFTAKSMLHLSNPAVTHVYTEQGVFDTELWVNGSADAVPGEPIPVVVGPNSTSGPVPTPIFGPVPTPVTDPASIPVPANGAGPPSGTASAPVTGSAPATVTGSAPPPGFQHHMIKLATNSILGGQWAR